MSHRYSSLLIAAFAITILPVLAHAIPLGDAQLTSVTPVDGGCVAGPTGPAAQAWDVEPGMTYTITISGVTDCANDGTDPTMNVRVNSTDSGNTDLVAAFVAAGVYAFDFTIPADATCTLPVFYCTTPGDDSSGMFARRDDGGAFQAHLRAATFEAGCTNPQEIIGPACGAVPTRPHSWGQLKTLYR